MIITCPECHSRYHVDGDSLKETREVRCVSCRHHWVQPPVSYAAQENFLEAASAAASSAALGTSGPRFASVRLWVWGLSLGVCVLVASFMMGNQKFLKGLWINATSFVALLSSKTQSPQEVFKITHLRTEVAMPDPPHKEIRLSGSITNTSSQVQALVPLKIHFWGENPQTPSDARQPPQSESILLETRAHVLPQSHLLPGESLSFELALEASHPHLMATSVTF